MSNSSLTNATDSDSVIGFLIKWRKTLGVLCLVAAFISLFASFLITPLYRSTVILYPASSNSISKALLNENPAADKDILEFGEDAQTEQMLQILNSGRLRDKVVAKFNLAGHYGIDSTSRLFHTWLNRQYEANINFKRTEYMAVKITVLDKDPQMAADIANSLAALLDSVKNDMQKQRAI
ncbi:MAG TPA: Wzz/FepE/Etk N-terminal domain-containing protein, partial [Bacteroidales bacterium]|nr:Wzz/FepE/Etk N-terminal domain-containing protein [Bacteroidales bacterium]